MQKMQNEYKRRNEVLLKNTTYNKWHFNKSTEDIFAEFANIQQWRQGVWYLDPTAATIESHPEFMVSQQLLISGRYRNPRLIAFEYNATDASYNSSTVFLNGLQFLALEAPSQQSVQAFNYLMHNHKVTHLVRLTPEYEKEVEKCFAYWKGNVIFDERSGIHYLNIPLPSDIAGQPPYTLHYVWTDTWIDHASGDPQQLHDLIMQTRKTTTPEALIAVHCHSGVARTGTFIAGYLLLHEIDVQLQSGVAIKDISISIEKIVKQLSLQRYYMVGEPTQYQTLYRLVDNYMRDKS